MSHLDPLLEKKDNESIDDVINRHNKLKGPGVYQIRVVDDDTFYIGASSRTKTRLDTHLRELKDNKHCNEKLQESYNNSSDKVLEISIFTTSSLENAFAVEKDLIKKNKERKNCANIKDSCIPSMLGMKHSEETRQKISHHNKEYYKNPKINPFYGKKHTEITKHKLKQNAEEYYKNPINRERQKSFMCDRMKDPANREVSRQAAINAWKDPEYRSKSILIRQKQFSDPKFRELNKQSQIKRMKDPANREVSRQAAINQWKDPEMRKKLIECRWKKITIDGVTYNNTKEAVRIAGDSKVRKQRKLEKEILNHD